MIRKINVIIELVSNIKIIVRLFKNLETLDDIKYIRMKVYDPSYAEKFLFLRNTSRI